MRVPVRPRGSIVRTCENKKFRGSVIECKRYRWLEGGKTISKPIANGRPGSKETDKKIDNSRCSHMPGMTADESRRDRPRSLQIKMPTQY